jgi:phosphotransferase system enzyme I (PtsP)
MKAQARALLEAAAGRELNIMFPMVSEPWEFDEAKALVEHQREWLIERRKALPFKVNYGAMLEVPALAEVLDILLPKVISYRSAPTTSPSSCSRRIDLSRSSRTATTG